jgi:hypothetical protein
MKKMDEFILEMIQIIQEKISKNELKNQKKK